TLHPNLGVVAVDERELVLADIPGLIEGAHLGHGLGDRFLGHIERCRVLVHLVDATGEDVGEAYRVVRDELAAYDAGLAAKPELLALNKVDALDAEMADAIRAELAEAAGLEPASVFLLSGAAGIGTTPLMRAVAERIAQADRAELPPPPAYRGPELGS
ncbi:MAG: 50S ribosome-binding GTPase, partial [Rhodospirillaceae bacterium]|nr:50S ribosome-binding GTPase [Rhodospirillaceae bacterium]